MLTRQRGLFPRHWLLLSTAAATTTVEERGVPSVAIKIIVVLVIVCERCRCAAAGAGPESLRGAQRVNKNCLFGLSEGRVGASAKELSVAVRRLGAFNKRCWVEAAEDGLRSALTVRHIIITAAAASFFFSPLLLSPFLALF